MKIREVLKREWEITRAKPHSFTIDPPRRPTTVEKHCILLHGFHSTGWQMTGWRNALLQSPEADEWTLWNLTYDTHWRSFRRVARHLRADLNRRSHDWTNTIFIGYSMGGVLARQIVAYDFPCRALISLCSPHEGAFGPLDRMASLFGWQREIHVLNANRRDQSMRSRYHCFAVEYDDERGHHTHDGLVTRTSALGEHLGSMAHRETIRLNYAPRPRFSMEPHLAGMYPNTMQPALDYCKQLLTG